MKRFGISSLLLLASLLRPAATDAQIYAKLNGLYALVGVVNPAVEFRLTDHSAFQTEFVYSPWKSINVDGQSKPMHFGIFLNEYRYYFRGYARGWYVGGNAGMMAFRMSKPYIENWRLKFENRYCKGYGMMIGLCAGYEYQFGERWLLDADVGWAWMDSHYNGYSFDGEIDMNPHRPRSGIPTRSAFRSATGFSSPSVRRLIYRRSKHFFPLTIRFCARLRGGFRVAVDDRASECNAAHPTLEPVSQTG